MYKVLIVDDESFIRERLKTMIPWHEYGLEVTGLAEDGESALRLMERKRPDIVICDVRMPDMTGLDMIGKAILLHPDVHYIILSAYGEFGLVKKAMQLGVADYLLKPTQPDEPLEVIMKLVDRLDLSRRKKERDALTLSYLEAIRAQCIHELILGNHPGYGWEDECVNVGLEWLTKGNLRSLLICMDRLGFQKDLEALKTAQFAVQNVMYELVSEHQAICPVRLSVGRWLLAVGEGVSDEWSLHFSGTLRDSIARYTKLSIHIMISEPGEHVLDLGRLFWETEKTMDYLGQDPVHPVRFIQPSQKELAYGYWSKPMQELIRWIADGRTESIDLWLRQLGTSFLSWDLESAQKWCFEWSLTLSEHLQHEGQDERCAGTDGLRMQIASQYRNKESAAVFRTGNPQDDQAAARRRSSSAH
ncbi:response regulator [Paenibacillus sp. P25]|nr:response regulator [Paenibacillus sp. P25]